MLIIKYFVKLFKALQSDIEPSDLARGFTLGMIIGLTPISSLHNIAVLILIFIFRSHISMALLAFIIFSGFAYIFDPFFHNLGFSILTNESLKATWTVFYNTPIMALANFNNTVVMGSLVIALVLTIPVFYFWKWFVVYYREHLDPKVKRLKIVQIVKASKIYRFYEKVGGGS